MQNFLSRPLNWSFYLKRYIDTRPAAIEPLYIDSQTPITPERIDIWLAELGTSTTAFPPPDITTCRSVLRQLRTRIFNTLIVRDINQLASLEEVFSSMSYLADIAVQMAYRTIMHTMVESFGIPTSYSTGLPMEMIILGMGKLGGKELNVSSDIDLIMLYGEEGETSGARRSLSYHEFYGRVTQRMMPVLAEFDAEGFVFRTDLRLRPDGDGSALAWSLSALEHYLITQGREWERYAWLKARVIPVKYFNESQPIDDIRLLESLRKPFVYRKYFDFDALSALRQLREQIRQEWTRQVNAKEGLQSTQNIKLGEGGIREIEFIVQLIQLIRGGRQASLQQRHLLDALQAERNAGLLTPEIAENLEKAYRFLRRLEHIIQYKEDAQTHLLPNTEEGLTELATAMGLNRETFDSHLKYYRTCVSETFHNIFRLLGMQEEQDILPTPSPLSNDGTLTEDEQAPIQQRIDLMLNNRRILQLSPTNRKRLDNLIPLLRSAAYATKNPIQATHYLTELIETIAQRSAYIALLVEYPEILQRVARIMTASPVAAQLLIKNPILLDSLIDWRTLLQPIDLSAIAEQLHKDLDACLIHEGEPDIERQMNLMRDTHKMVAFQLLAQDLENTLNVEYLADYLSALADMLLEESLFRVWQQLRKSSRYDLPEHPRFGIIAYGKLGGKELGYFSDLDLVLIFDDDHDWAPEVYVKLGRRLSTWLSTMTSSGRLYEIDLRLRPDGEAGLLAVSIEGFAKYQREMAWTWEHQALTRGRFCAGDTAIGEKFEAIRQEILLRQRDLNTLKDDIIAMRIKMREGHPNPTLLFDVKHDQGGMVDLEFITQYLVLAYSHQHPALLGNWGNIALLLLAAQEGLIPEQLAKQCVEAYRVYRKIQHEERLQGKEVTRVEVSLLDKERTAVTQLWNNLFANLR
ncbi:bifunctional [glutamate--ammonia ligase]-adenylyl-L-tyrosine phosphorylase/[glutamate--ammonia-ligase] adenylyltransferase [Pelistega sp. NLN82]|uniref:Bifunctional glutamine synthetase adenylyltransferase/adenylyl-removing enzyme n=1 Tax=Pelistega ratti TaxID=2652177 RepID=A0A6L9Y7H8_9BURK|nr:bifunctional [glutamate--ammonia ligase]-adenylyl-L-tyrosine phosphorylase/[glutamate--ammonia-ligase] adenylyltransferase [Pelistega ratti]NEN75718.1 bifunctional [glutamate--ammonia ligase]-adenylyl-L-tyrosine phosphorylase/[glutamate--ammonia-ligase] adenylyltransferase [Pelistega ratti]